MDPNALDASQQATALLGEALKGVPVLAVMWYMLRDVRSKVNEIVSDVAAMKLQIAGDNSAVKIQHMKERHDELKEESAHFKEKAEARLTLIENQLPAIWAKVGDRPEDNQRKQGVHQ